jgi:hypothetical protein
MLNVIMLNVIMLSVAFYGNASVTFFILFVVILSVEMVSGIRQNVTMLSFNVFNVVAPPV